MVRVEETIRNISLCLGEGGKKGTLTIILLGDEDKDYAVRIPVSVDLVEKGPDGKYVR